MAFAAHSMGKLRFQMKHFEPKYGLRIVGRAIYLQAVSPQSLFAYSERPFDKAKACSGPPPGIRQDVWAKSVSINGSKGFRFGQQSGEGLRH